MGLNVSGPSGPLSDTSVPTLIDVAVTPTSDAVLAALVVVADADPDRAVVDVVVPAPAFDTVVDVAAPPAAVVDVLPAATAAPSPRACSKAESGRRVPQPASASIPTITSVA